MGKGSKKASSSSDDFSVGDSDFEDQNKAVIKKPKAKAAPPPKKAAPKSKSKSKSKPSDDESEEEFKKEPRDDSESEEEKVVKPKSKPSPASASPKTLHPKAAHSSETRLNYGTSSHLMPPRRMGLSRSSAPPLSK